MAILHISEADAARNLGALLDKLTEVSEIVIERGDGNAVIKFQPKVEAGYDAWFADQVELAYADQDLGTDSQTAQAEFLDFRDAFLAQKIRMGLS